MFVRFLRPSAASMPASAWRGVKRDARPRLRHGAARRLRAGYPRPERRFSPNLGACAVEVLMLGDWRAAAGEVGFWPECDIWPARLWDVNPRAEGRNRKRFSFHTRSMGTARPGASALAGPAPASARGHRPHPLDVQRQAHEVPLAAHLRQASQAESSESEHLLDPPVRRLREPLALRVPGFARGARQFLTHAVRGREPGRVDRHLGLAFTPQRYGARRCRDLPAPTDPARCSSPHRPVPPQARPQTSR